MKNNYKVITFVLFLFVQTFGITNLNAQSIRQIDNLMLKYKYAESVVLLEKIVEKNWKHSQEAKEKLATCYRLMNQPEKAAKWYAQVVEQKEINPESHFYYGEALRTLGKYKQAQVQFLTYDTLVPNNEKGATLLAKYCGDILLLLDKSANYTIANAQDLNTKFSEFSPVILKNEVVFTSDRPIIDKRSKRYSWTGTSFLDLYASKIDFQDETFEFTSSIPEIFSQDLSQTFHDGTAVFSKDGNTVIFTRVTNSRVKKEKNPVPTIVLKMYTSKIIDGEWGSPEPFYLNSNEYSVGHPTLSSDGTKLYFVSDMPNGFGGTDLYVCSLEDGKWTNHENLGNVINTSGAEMFPYMNDDGALYFSSAGHFGYGGLDLFTSSLSNGNWQIPENIGKPLNSSYDDFGICFAKEGTGFFSSNRPEGKGFDDIYSFKRLKSILLSGRVVSSKGDLLVQSTVFLLNESTEDILVLKTDSLGKYSTEIERNSKYSLLAKKDKYLEDCIKIQVENESVNPSDLILDSVQKDKLLAVENIYYDLDKWFIRPDAEPVLDHVVKIMAGNPIRIELGSHTDCRANDNYNVVLAQKRAQAAVNYIIAQGIDSTRIIAKGYGETQLINECSDGVDCTEEAHQLNRRTEFKIIEVEQEIVEKLDPLLKFLEGDIYKLNDFDKNYFRECK